MRFTYITSFITISLLIPLGFKRGEAGTNLLIAARIILG